MSDERNLTWKKFGASDSIFLFSFDFFFFFFNMTNEGYIIKQYNRRWINLILFVIYAINNSIHCNQYTVITDSISAYYNVPKLFVEWTSGLFSLTYVIFFAPVLYGMEKIVSLWQNYILIWQLVSYFFLNASLIRGAMTTYS